MWLWVSRRCAPPFPPPAAGSPAAAESAATSERASKAARKEAPKAPAADGGESLERKFKDEIRSWLTKVRTDRQTFSDALDRLEKKFDVEVRGERKPAIKAMILRELERKEHKARA